MTRQLIPRSASDWTTVGVGVIVVLYALGTLYAFRPLFDEHIVVNDACQHIAPIYTLQRPDIFRDDLLTEYKLSYLPLGFRWLYAAAALVVDPLLFSTLMTYVLFIAAWFFAWKIGNALGGPVCGWLTLLLLSHSEFLAARILGGLFRGFAPALFLAFLYCWIQKRHQALAATLLLAALFYPPLFLVSALAFGMAALADLKRWWSERRTSFLLIGAAVLLGLVAAMAMARKPAHFGDVITLEEASEMREWSRGGGRLQELPMLSAGDQLGKGLTRGLHATRKGYTLFPKAVGLNRHNDDFTLWVYLGLTMLGLLAARDKPWWWLSSTAATLMLYGASRALAFRLGWPDRYADYFLGINVVLLFPVYWRAVHQRLPTRKALASVLGLVPVICVFVFYPTGFSGIKRNKATDISHVLELTTFASSLPATSYFAGWPLEDMDYIYLLSHRRVLVDFESAHPLYRGYYDEVRQRTLDTFALYFATEVETVRRIRDRYGLTHLALRRKALTAGESLPKLYEPLRSEAKEIRKKALETGLFFASPSAEAVAYESDAYVVVDLRRLE